MVGLANVGKSSLINSLKRKHAAPTGNAPGVTTTVQEVHLDKKVTLLDSPGIVFSAAGNAHAALLNCTKVRPTQAAPSAIQYSYLRLVPPHLGRCLCCHSPGVHFGDLDFLQICILA